MMGRQFLRQWGRGTTQSVVEGQVPHGIPSHRHVNCLGPSTILPVPGRNS